jgi:subtilisin family serine protease
MRCNMRIISAVAVALSLSVPLAARAQARNPAQLAQLRDSVRAVGGRVIVLLKSTVPGASVRVRGRPPLDDAELQTVESRLRTRHGLRVRGHAPMIGAVFGDADETRLAELNADSNVVSVEADKFVALQSVRDGVATPASAMRAQTVPWGITHVMAPDAWLLGFTGAGVKVGMMDSGGDPTHPDLVWAGGYNANTGGTSPSDWADDVASCNGHGTHVAGTVAARDNSVGVVGVAPDVSLYALKVFVDIGGTCGAWVSAQMLAVQWAVSHGIRVVSASLGGSGGGSYLTAIQAAADAGTFLVAAAGNDNGGAVEFPAAFAPSIAVSSLSASNTVSSFSSVGPQIQVGAPGENVMSTMPGGGYGTKSGTSMATPHVTGVVALLVQQNPGITLAGVRQALKNGALDIGPSGFDNGTGWGLVRAAPSLQGGATAPLTLSLSPASRNVAIVLGAGAPADNATVTLAGTNASTTAWTATKKKSWTTLITATGTGNGTVFWSRNATGLAVGTYVDTITVTAPGAASGSPAVLYDTLRITAVVVPVTLALAPRSRNVAVTQGTNAPSDNATITLTGTNAATTAWSATKKKNWTTLTTASGTGSGLVAWSRSASGLAVGTYVDTITVTAPGAASGSPAVLYDTLRVTSVVVPVTLAVAPGSRNVAVTQGTNAPGDNATITLTGTIAATTAWSATKKKSWTTLTTVSGTGSGTVAWSRSASGLAVGTYVDTITVTAPGAASGSPATIYDTMRITAVVVPVTMAVAPRSRNVAVTQGTNAPGDNATVTLTGTNAATTAWNATKKKSWTTLTTASGTGSGTVAWSRSASGLAVGTYVDTITVTAPGATGSPGVVYDTMRITAVVVPVTLAVTPGSRNVEAMQGTAAPNDNATVMLTGTNAATTAWSATKKKSWTTLTTATGTGSGAVAWSRNASGLAVGTYVDTISVASAGVSGSPATIYDTLRITAALVPVVLAVNPSSRNVAVTQGTSAPGDNASVTLTGSNAASTAWSATNKKSWTTLTSASGTGSGTVAWSRNASGLAVGTYVDTINVTAAGAASGSPAVIYDTMRITAASVPVVLAVSPSSRTVAVTQGTNAPGDNATISLTGTAAATTAWSATKKQSWTTLTTTSGIGSGTVTWTRNVRSLAAGTYVDTITVTAPGAAGGSPALVFDTVRIAATTVSVHPGSKKKRVFAVGAASSDVSPAIDSARVQLDSGAGPSDTWSANTTSSRLQILRSNGPMTSALVWQRMAITLPVGLYIDTLHVAIQRDANIQGIYVDTLEIVAVTMPDPAVAVAELFHSNALTDDQRTVLDLQGNGNGTYDIGDFLAWVDHDHLHLSASVVARLKELSPPASPASDRSRIRPAP